MKHILITIALFFTCLATSQQTIVFKNSFFPNSKYISQTLSKVSGTIDFIADEATLNELKSGGMELPMVMEQESSMVAVSETGEKDDQGNIPFVMYYDKMEKMATMSGNEVQSTENPFSGAKIYGLYTSESLMKIDSIVGGNLDEQLKSTLKSILDQVQQQIDFPKEPIAIGDSFSNEIPMSVPMGNLQPMDIIIKTNYHLKDVKEKMAFFDIDQTLSLNSEQKEMNLAASGEGTGKLQFDTEKCIILRNETDLPMKMTISMPNNMSMEMQMETSTIITTRIE